jgi:hypothetical protein
VAGGPEGEAELHAHHLEEVSEGGNDSLENPVTLCSECHYDRHQRQQKSEAKDGKLYQCPEPVCHGEFRTKHGAKVHYAVVHGGQLSKGHYQKASIIECACCGTKWEAQGEPKDDEKYYCSESCADTGAVLGS